ncbi:MAG: hypothetical protein ACFE8L_11365 [Candidatus Hodarchaeota archaeon]
MSDINQIMNNIKEIFEKRIAASIKKKIILSHLFNLRAKEEFQYLSDSEFFDIVREIYNFKPQFFIKWLYKDLRDKILGLYGAEIREEIERFIQMIEDQRAKSSSESKLHNIDVGYFCWKFLIFYIFGGIFVTWLIFIIVFEPVIGLIIILICSILISIYIYHKLKIRLKVKRKRDKVSLY